MTVPHSTGAAASARRVTRLVRGGWSEAGSRAPGAARRGWVFWSGKLNKQGPSPIHDLSRVGCKLGAGMKDVREAMEERVPNFGYSRSAEVGTK